MRPPPTSRPSWPSGDDDGLFVLLVLVVGGGLLLWLAWDTWRAEIAAAAIALFRWEIALLTPVTDRFAMADRQMEAANPARVQLAHLTAMAHEIGHVVRWPVTAVLVLLAALCACRAPSSRFRRRLGLDDLLAEQAEHFPTAAAFAQRRLRLCAPAEGLPRPADLALTAEEWIARFARAPDGSLDRDAARRALATQLGAPWNPAEQAAPQVRLLLAAVALHLAGRRDASLALLGAASRSLAEAAAEDGEGPQAALTLPARVTRAADAALTDPGIGRPALAILARHAYATTGLMSLLTEARRRSGVLAPASFAWLRLVDRPLWYALAPLGFEADGPELSLHPSARAEGAGSRSHWEAERLAGRPLPEPEVGSALDAITRGGSTA